MSYRHANPPAVEFTLTLRIPASRPVAFRAAVALRTLLDDAKVWPIRSRHRRALARLDLHMLEDIGITPAQRDRECAKPFWQA